MESCLYTGQVGHQRLTPVGNAFRYSLFFLYLDLAELDTVFAGSLALVGGATELGQFPSFGLLHSIIRCRSIRPCGTRCSDSSVSAPAGPVRLLTHLRYLGYCFNPISIYYCFAEDGHTLEAFLVEIHNTPWGEEYLRAFDARTDHRMTGNGTPYRLDKEFHVSPFMPMDIDYDWRFTPPGERLAVHMTSRRQGT